MKKWSCWFVVAATLSISGCATKPPLNFSAPDVRVSHRKIDAELKSMTVTIARPDEKTGNLPAGMEVMVPQLWHTSLLEAVNKMAIFQDDSRRKVNLSVKILKLDIPIASVTFETNVGARYEVVDRKTGAILLSVDISSSGIVPFDYAFAGYVRQAESVNRSVQNNILQFLHVLESANL